jgi:hypothetical protein
MIPDIEIIKEQFVNGAARAFMVAAGRMINGLAFKDRKTIWFPHLKLNPFNNDLSCIFDMRNRGFGYMNRAGEIVLEAKYLTGSDYSEGRACVFDGDNVHLLNEQCSVIKTFDGALVTMDQFHDGIMRVSQFDSEKAEMRIDGFIDRNGEFVLPIQYPSPITVPSIYDRNDLYSDGLIRIWKNGKYGFIDIHGDEVIPPIYSTATCFCNEYAAVTKEGELGFINKLNSFMGCESEEKHEDLHGFSEGLAAFKLDGLWGYIDTEGFIVIDAMFISAGYFKNDMAPVRTKEGMGLTGKDMRVIVTPIFDSIEVFQEGITRVVKRGLEGVLDTEGNVLFAEQTEYQEIFQTN